MLGIILVGGKKCIQAGTHRTVSTVVKSNAFQVLPICQDIMHPHRAQAKQVSPFLY